jgi:hypothetical protein
MVQLINTFDLHLFMISINSFLPTPVILRASAALKFGILSYGCSANIINKSDLKKNLLFATTKKLPTISMYSPPPTFQIVGHFSYSRSNFSNFDQIYRMNQHLQHETSFLKFSMKYVLIVHLFELVHGNTFF